MKPDLVGTPCHRDQSPHSTTAFLSLEDVSGRSCCSPLSRILGNDLKQVREWRGPKDKSLVRLKIISKIVRTYNNNFLKVKQETLLIFHVKYGF